ncbi:hypothetical protein KY347_04815 [Candidatus Woesearchaeota archaeon]|nr:hypothetical protein [Candidatus Woesearchaeota archaeon]
MNSLETKRKLAHLLLGVLIVALILLGFIGKTHLFILIIAGIILSFLSKKYRIPVICLFLENFERKEDLKKFPGKGVIFYLIGAFMVLFFFPIGVAIPSILILAFAEPASYLLGSFGRIPHPLKSKRFLEGFIAGLIAGFIAAVIFVQWHEALAASFFAMVAEGIEIKIGAEEVDDNIIIPLVSAVTISVVRLLF